MSKTVDKPKLANLSKTVDLLKTADLPKTVDVCKTVNLSKSADLPKTSNLPKTADLPKTVNLPKPADLPKTAGLTKTAYSPKTDQSDSSSVSVTHKKRGRPLKEKRLLLKKKEPDAATPDEPIQLSGPTMGLTNENEVLKQKKKKMKYFFPSAFY